MTAGLRLSDDLVLPEDTITQTIGILGKRASGKTTTAVVIAEELAAARLPYVVLDPLGVWWGLRSDAAGDGEGLPVLIFGGDHGALPLQETAGVALADFVADQRVPTVLDLSGLSKSAARRFVADFGERLFHRNREPLHLIVDEADLFAPQRVYAGGERCLGAVDDLVRRGRRGGIGVTLITQRPAVLNKDVLTQVELLVALRLTGPADIAAIKDWVRSHADDGQAGEVIGTLASLPTGTGWFWSPAWLGILQRVQVRPRWTYDSSATPKPGQHRPPPRRFAEVDVAKLGEQLAAYAELATAEDPRALRAQVADLQRQLADRGEQTPQVMPVPVVDEATRAGIVAAIEAWSVTAQVAIDAFVEAAGAALDRLDVQTAGVREGLARVFAAVNAASPVAALPGPPAEAPAVPAAPPAARPEGGRPNTPTAILTALARYGPLTAVQVGIVTGRSHRGGSFQGAVLALRNGGFLTGRGILAITDAGREHIGELAPLPTGEALLDHWAGALRSRVAVRRILGLLVSVWPQALTAEEIAGRLDYAAGGGSFQTAVSRIQSFGLAERDGGPGSGLRAAELLVRAVRGG